MPITLPAPASGLIKRPAPRMTVLIDGNPIPFVLSITTTRGLDQEMATADITLPWPAPDYMRMWAQVVILIGPLPDSDYVERFTGYIVGPGASFAPGTETFHCEDVLAIAKYTYTAVEMNLVNETDNSAIQRILTEGCGYSAGILDFGSGTGKILGDVDDAQLFWEEGSTALSKIQEIDQVSLGWRTFGSAGGLILRRYIDTDPNVLGEVHWFYEGVDMLDGSMSAEIKDAKQEVTVTGWGDVASTATLDPENNPFDPFKNSYWIRFKMLQRQATDAGILSTEEVATYILSQLNKNIIRVTFSTHLGVHFQAQEVIGITSTKLWVDQRFWVQSVQTSVGENGNFTQTITAISELNRDVQRGIMLPPILTTGTPKRPLAIPATPTPRPILSMPPLVSFRIVAVDREFAAPGAAPLTDHGTTHYIVTASDASSSRVGQITDRTWAAAGTGVSVTSGSGQTFTTGFETLVGATITLTIEDEHGQTATKTLPVQTFGVPTKMRKLYAITDSTFEAWNGTTWNSFTPGDAVQVVANGPFYGHLNKVAVTEDDLATPPSVDNPALPGGETITAIWRHESRRDLVVVGGSAGSVALTSDRGQTWVAKTALSSAVQFIIISLQHPKEFHAVTAAGWHTSTNEGGTWSLVQPGSFAYLELAPGRNIVVTAAGVLEQARKSTEGANVPFTGPTVPIVAATAHIRSDRFYALGNDGSTWVQDAAGSFAMVPGEPVPDGGIPVHAGTYRDGTVVDLVYFATSTGLYKTVDGFRTPQGYYRLRQNGLLTP